ncbi:MAG: T9SS type A sorting domain-containing protein, partial [Gemmatimonadetes bacterium]|nr:T9SS type A sorting domain-containing protein [Gemmatimonadota bacterium]
VDSQGFINTALDQDDSTGVILGPINATTDAISYNYDFLIDPGVIIWHVDERQALANLLSGRGLNVIFDKRSVTIEEADGIVDIGSPFSFFPLGTDKEAFHADNNANFTPDTRPNSDSNLGSPSGIAIRNIGERGMSVRMDFEFGSKPRGWPMEIGPYGSSGLTSTTIADVDGDGEPEIAAAGDSTFWMFEYEDRDGDGEVDPAGAWPQPTAGLRTFGTAEFTQALGDLDGDGIMEVIVATDSGAVHCWSAAGAPFGAADSTGLLATFPVEDRLSWSAVPADLNRDGADELYFTTLDGRLNGWDVSSGTPVPLFSPRPLLGALADSVETLVSTIAFGDLNADNVLDGIVAYVHENRVNIQRFDRAGTRTLRISQPIDNGLEAERVFIGLADLDGDKAANDLEILLATDAGWITLLDSDGQTAPGWPIIVTAPIDGPPAFGDLDGDGLLEIALTSGGRDVHAINYNGTSMPGWPVKPEIGDFPGFGTPVPGPAIADVDGDGRQDVVVGLVDFTVRALAPDGKLVDGFPFVTGNTLRSTPCVVDANGDGTLDLFVQSTDGHVYARRLAGTASATNPQWPMFGGGPSLHSSYDASRTPVAISAGTGILRGPVQVYPNPVMPRHEEFTVRYTLGSASAGATEVRVRMYNLAGEQVREMEGSAFPNTQNEIRVPTGDLAPGVYFCSLRARSGAEVETQMDKFAVIR